MCGSSVSVVPIPDLPKSYTALQTVRHRVNIVLSWHCVTKMGTANSLHA